MQSYKIFENPEQASHFTAELIAERAKNAIEKNGIFRLVLTGGSSPLKLHQLLTSSHFEGKIDWSKIHIFWGDERFVSYESDLSNTRMAYETLIDKIDIPQANVFPMVDKALDVNSISVEQAAAEYEKSIKAISNIPGKIPVFDMVLLGVGSDGHTASWFPGTQVVNEKDKLVSTSFNSEQNTDRITLTPPLVLAASLIVPLVFGKGKSDTLKEVTEGKFQPDNYPAQLLREASHEVIWVLDNESASALSKT